MYCISKTRANLEKPMSFSDSATSKYPKTVKISLALEKKFFLLSSVFILLLLLIKYATTYYIAVLYYIMADKKHVFNEVG